MRKTALIIGAIIILSGCGAQSPSNGKINVVASFYPLYEIAKQVGGDFVNVKNLVPAGAEPHDYEPTPQDIIALHKAKLVIYNGAGLEPWADKIVPELESEGVQTINESKNFNDITKLDPHIWMDPVRYMEEVGAVEKKLEEIDPANTAVYKSNADAFRAKIAALDERYKAQGFSTCVHQSFVTNHAAFGYLAQRYSLTMIPIAGLSPDAEPSPKALVNIADVLKKQNIKYILVESLVSPKVAETLANEVGAQILVLNPLEGLTDQQLAEGKDYISVMNENLLNLRIALECHE